MVATELTLAGAEGSTEGEEAEGMVTAVVVLPLATNDLRCLR